jgi:hypothetical protein
MRGVRVLELTCLRVILTAMLLLVAGQVRAEWEKVAEIEQTVFYLDPATIQVKGHLRRVWQLRDWKVKNKDEPLSARILREYDCKDARNRVLAVTEFAGPMATGTRLRSSGFAPAQWEQIERNTAGAIMLERVCSR